MTDKEKPRKFTDYLYKVIPKRVRKAAKLLKSIKARNVNNKGQMAVEFYREVPKPKPKPKPSKKKTPSYIEAIETGLPRIKKRKPTSKQIAETKKRNKAREQEQSKEGKFRADFDKSVDKRIKKEGREPYKMARHDEKVRESAKKHKGK